MSTLIVLAIIAFVVWQKAGPAKRGHWRRQVERALHPELTKIRRQPRTPERFRRSVPPTSVILDRSSLPPPSSNPPPDPELRPARQPVEDQPEAVVEEVPPPPSPGDPVVISVPVSEAEPEPSSEDVPTSEPAVTDRDESPPAATDADLTSVIAAVFERDDPPHTRAARFASAYAGTSVEWTATVLRSSRGRRHREPATRAELLLGYASERQFFSDRVIAEAYFPADIALDDDTELSFRGTMTEANVYGNRLVIDHAERIDGGD